MLRYKSLRICHGSQHYFKITNDVQENEKLKKV